MILESLKASALREPLRLDFLEDHPGNVKPFMRRQVGEWLLAISERYKCPSYVFSHAMIFMDHYLFHVGATPDTLQLLGASALLLASKCVNSVHCGDLSLPTLCANMDDAFSVQQLKSMELKLLDAIDWNPNSFKKPHDYLDEYISLLCQSQSFRRQAARIQRHTDVFVDISYLDHDLSSYGPETVAAASLQYAMGAREFIVDDIDCSKSILALNIYSTNTEENFLKCLRDLHDLCGKFDLCNLQTAKTYKVNGTVQRKRRSSDSVEPTEELSDRPSRRLRSSRTDVAP